MPRTIEEGFRDFLVKLTPLTGESESAKRHRESIEACLRSSATVHRFFRSGSFGHGTSIANYSDVDYFVSLASEDLSSNSTLTLRKYRTTLMHRFPYTAVGVRSPALRLRFGVLNAEITEVVPAHFTGHKIYGYPIYLIPDGRGGWRESCPEGHNAFVNALNQRLGGKAKPLIRFIKAWKFFQDVPVSSFYLELRIALYLKERTDIVYGLDVANILRWLDDNGLPKVQDPLGLSGYISPCWTNTGLLKAKSKLHTAAVRATKAVTAEEYDRLPWAFNWWRLLFGERFPRYYK